jgi:TolB protein
MLARIAVAASVIAAAVPARAQDTSHTGVHIGLNYQPGTKPGVVVLPIAGVGGDTAHSMMQRDLDYADALNVISDIDPGLGSATVNYPLIEKLGAAAVVQAFLTPASLHVIVHDVVKRKVLVTRDVAMPASVGSADWRMAIHDATDWVQQAITGSRGIAASRIAFIRDGQVYITDTDGADTRPVTQKGGGPLSPAWQPSGRFLTYSFFGARGTQIAVLDLTTGSARALSATPTGLNSTPTFTPDGNSIVYTHGDENGTDLYLAPAVGTEPSRRITVGHGTDNTQPTFSPDGRRLAFTSGRSGHPEVYIVNIDGTEPDLLTPFQFGDDIYRASPNWSPDGRLVAFESRVGGRFQIETIALRDHTVKQLTSDGINEDPKWAPDGRHLVFTSNRTGVRQLFVLDAESGRTRQLTFGGPARLPAWSRSLASP